MKKIIFSLLLMGAVGIVKSQSTLKFTEYDLPNGLHVILHQNTTAPVVAVSVMYRVGSKNDDSTRTGFAHFFEHLLFEGTKNIKRGEFQKIVTNNGGQNNANTSQDRTFYYEVFPSNLLELGLWLESERMLHPVINEIGVNTQREVVKEERRLRFENQPYGLFLQSVLSGLYQKHPYRFTPIGSMEHLNAAQLSEFIAFFKKFYVPNNAVLSIAGDIDIAKTKAMIAKYFIDIPKGAPVVQPNFKEPGFVTEKVDSVFDANIQIPALILSYITPGKNERDAIAMDYVSNILSGSKSSRLRKELVDKKQMALEVFAQSLNGEDYSTYVIGALPNGEASLEDLKKNLDIAILELQTNLISDAELNKVRIALETQFADRFNRNLGIAESLADAYTFRNKNTNYVNTELKAYLSITKEDIRNAAKKYLQSNNRFVLQYLPKR